MNEKERKNKRQESTLLTLGGRVEAINFFLISIFLLLYLFICYLLPLFLAGPFPMSKVQAESAVRSSSTVFCMKESKKNTMILDPLDFP